MAVNYGDKNFQLSNGYSMPAIGFGTLRMNNENVVFNVLDKALANGYRLFDTAAIYGNERQIGEAFEVLLDKHGLQREDIFITTKLSPACCTQKMVAKSFQRSLDNLKMEYVDLYMINYPAPTLFPNKQTLQNSALRLALWSEIAKLYNESKIRAIGVSNFTIAHLLELTENTSTQPMVNQIEWHPYCAKNQMLSFCQKNNIQVQAFSSFGGLSRGDRALVNESVLATTATRHAVSVNQVLLAWSLQRGVAVIPTSRNSHHMIENRDINFKLSDREMLEIDNLNSRCVYYRRDPADVI